MNKYTSIINLNHYEPKNHKRMPIPKRAAQFMPFSALAGYDTSIKEEGRITSKKIELSSDDIININNKINIIKKDINNTLVSITYFIPDRYKEGGTYITKKDIITKIDSYNQTIITKDKTIIPINDILDIEICGR